MFVSHIDQAGEVSLSQVLEDRGFVEEGEGGHVLHLAELWRVHLLDVVFVHRQLLAIGELHQHLHSRPQREIRLWEPPLKT